jgi:hypothetical protein
MSKNAQEIIYGGETASLDGRFEAGQMGNGNYPGDVPLVATHRLIFYIGPGTGTDTTWMPRWAALVESETNPTCYRIDIYNVSDIYNNTNYILFGGPKCP